MYTFGGRKDTEILIQQLKLLQLQFLHLSLASFVFCNICNNDYRLVPDDLT